MILSLHGIVNKISGPIQVLASLLTNLYSVWNADISANTLETNLYAVYNGDGDATDMIGNRSGNPVNGASFTTGKLGQAFSFDGVNDYISLPNNTLNLTGDFSISFWYYTNVINAEKYIISNWNSNTANSHIHGTGFIVPMSSTNKIGITIYNTGFTSVLSNTSLSINTWYHVTITRKSATNTKIYINGSLDATGTSVKDTVYNPVTFSSSIGNTVGVGGGYVNGRIDGLSFWTRELSAADVTQLYNSGNGLQYPFTKDTTIASPKNQFGVENGVLMNGATYGTGKIGNAFAFDGVNDYISLPTNSLNLTEDFSISCWISLGSLTTRQAFVGNYFFTNTGDMGIKGIRLFYGAEGTSNSGGVRLDIGNDNGISLITNNYLSTNTWYHIVATRKKSIGSKIYINGTLAASNNSTFNPGYTTSYPSIGAAQYAQNALDWYMSNGSKLDAINIWKKELTQEEVTNLYNSGNGQTLTQSPIVTDNLLFNLDAARAASYAGSGTTIFDNSGNATNATIMPTIITPGAIGTNGATYKSTGIPRFIFNYSADGSYGGNSYAKIPLSTTTDANGYTFGGWVQCLSASANIFHKGADSIYGGWALMLGFSPSSLSIQIINASSQMVTLGGTTTSTAGQWYYITGQYIHGSGLKVYKNGQLINSMTQGATAISLRNSPGWTIAATATTSIGQCVVSTYHAYNRVLTSSEILQNFDNTKTNYGY